jgi:hypothetical protein
MVKAGNVRADKFFMKNDAYCNMLRAKRMRNFAITSFTKAAFQSYILQSALDQIATLNNLVWGARGRLYDLAQQEDKYLADYLAQGFTEDIYNQVVAAKNGLKALFHICKYPKSKLISSISIFPIPLAEMFPISEDWLLQVTTETAEEDIALENANMGVSILEAEVCAHNTVNTLLAMLSNPLVEQTEIGMYPVLHSALIWLINPFVFPILSRNVVLLATNNESPILNISVIKTP